MRKITEYSKVWMTVLGGLLYHIIFVIIIANSSYETFPKILLAIMTLLFGPITFFFIDCIIKTLVQEFLDNGLRSACIIFLKLHIIWVPLILVTILLYLISTSTKFILTITSPSVLLLVALIIAYAIKIYYLVIRED